MTPPPGTTRGRCDRCGAPMLWAITAANRRPIPLDEEPDPGGNIEIRKQSDGSHCAVVLSKAEREALTLLPAPRFMPHHATCPDVEHYR